jgi:hypothetical protein
MRCAVPCVNECAKTSGQSGSVVAASMAEIEKASIRTIELS